MTAEHPPNPVRVASFGPTSRLGDLLIKRGLITDEQMQQALEHQREKQSNKLLGQILLDLEYVSRENLVATLADAAGVQFRRVDGSKVDLDVINLLPRSFIRKHRVLPLSVTDDELTVAVEDFTNVFLIEDIERLVGLRVNPVAATDADIEQTLESIGVDGEEFAFDDILDEMQVGDLKIMEEEVAELTSLDLSDDSPVIKLVNAIIHGAVSERASDIHIEPERGGFRVRYRIDGELIEKLHPPRALLAPVISRIKIMAGLDIAERRLPQDGAITVMMDRAVDLRVSVMPTRSAEKVVMRVVDTKVTKMSLDRLGFAPEMLKDLRRAIAEPSGVMLVTGPTGSGKTTTLYACLSELVTPRVNLSTVEDPIEYSLSGVNQSQVNARADFTFARALRALLRQDPDVIMVGEIRDGETAQIAIQAALTGHLVLSTLHTNDAPSAVTRLTNMGIEPFLVAATVHAVLAQRLVRRNCEHCSAPTEINDIVRETLRFMFGKKLPIKQFHAGSGCARCRQSGTAGRLGIYELFIPDEEMLEAIAAGASLQDIRRLAKRGRGYTTLRDDGIEKVREGKVTIEAMLKIVTRKSEGGDALSDDAGALAA